MCMCTGMCVFCVRTYVHTYVSIYFLFADGSYFSAVISHLMLHSPCTFSKYEYESVGHSWKHAGSSENKSLFNQVSSSKRRAIANSVHQPSSWMPAAKAPTTCSRSSTRNTQHPPVCPSASQVCGTKRKFHKFDSECVCTPSSHTTKSCYIMIWCHIRTCTLHCDLPFVTNCIATCHL